MQLPSLFQHLLHVIKYTTFDELHENDACLTIDVLLGCVKESIVSMNLHIWHLFVSHVKFHCNVDFAVDQYVFKVRRLLVCSNRWSLKKLLC